MVPADRQKILIRAIEDHAARYVAPYNPMGGLNPARYVAEAHVPGGATPTERDFIAYYLRTHPEVLQRPPTSLAELDERNRREQSQARDQANCLSQQARQAYLAEDHTTAMALIDQAAVLDPAGRDWDDIRLQIHEAKTGVAANCPSGAALPSTFVGSPTPRPSTNYEPPPAPSSSAQLAFQWPPQRIVDIDQTDSEATTPALLAAVEGIGHSDSCKRRR